jgi:hypothetical protein
MSDEYSCKYCGAATDDLRFGCCFDCATKGEIRAAKRTVLQHLAKGVWHLVRGFRWEAKTDCKWAWERLTRTGDYTPDGYFDREGIDWRQRS